MSLKHIYDMDEDEFLETHVKVQNLLKTLKINPDQEMDLKELFYDQLTQYTKKKLHTTIQIGGPILRMETYRKATLYGKKKTAENLQRARNRVTRPEITENMQRLEDRYKK